VRSARVKVRASTSSPIRLLLDLSAAAFSIVGAGLR